MPRLPMSPQKRYEIIRLWLLEHLTYKEISKRVGVALGTVSKTVNEFKEKAREMTLEEAARMFGVEDEVSALLGLSEALKEAGVAVIESKRVASLLRKLNEMNVGVDEAESWVKLCQKLSRSNFPVSDFVEAAIRLSKLEMETGLDYRALISEYEKKLSKFKALKKRVKDLERKRSLVAKLERRVVEAERRLSIYKALMESYRRLSTDVEKLIEVINPLKAKVCELSKNVRALKEERKRLDEELASKREELAKLNRKISEARRWHELLVKKCGELEILVDELQRRRNRYVEDIANYKMEYGGYMDMLNRVAAKLNGSGLKVEELRDLIVETLEDEAHKMANGILARWMREGLIVPVNEFTINVTCPHCNRTFSLEVNKEFMAKLVRGHGVVRVVPAIGSLPPLDAPRLPSPGSTTIQCPSCRGIIEITYEYIVGELSKKGSTT